MTISISFCHIHFDHFNIFLSNTYRPFQYFVVRYILTISIFCCQIHFDHFNILFCFDTFQPLRNLAPFLSYLLPEGLINPLDHLTFCWYSPIFAYSYYHIQLNRIIFLPWVHHAYYTTIRLLPKQTNFTQALNIAAFDDWSQKSLNHRALWSRKHIFSTFLI